MIQVGNGFIWFNKQATRWLGVWMVAHLTFKEHQNRCLKKARAAEARLRSLSNTYVVVQESVRAVTVACIQAVTWYGSEPWRDPNEVGRRHYLQLLLKRQARSVLGMLPTTSRVALLRKSGLTPAPVILVSRQQRFAVRLANACSRKLNELNQDPSSSTPICRVVRTDHKHGWTPKGMSWPAPGKEPVVKTIILVDKSIAKGAARSWAREKKVKVGPRVWMWWIDGSRSDDSRVGAAAVCKYSHHWRTHRSYLGTGHMEVFHAKLLAIGLALGEIVNRWLRWQEHQVKVVAVFSDSSAAIRRMEHLEPGLRQWLASRINQRAQALPTHGITTWTDCVPGDSGISRNQEAGRQANLTQDANEDTAIERPYPSASNGARRISEGRLVAKAKWEADKCSKHFSYRLKGKTGTKRPVLMSSVKSLATWFNRLKWGHAPTGVHLKRFDHQEDNKFW